MLEKTNRRWLGVILTLVSGCVLCVLFAHPTYAQSPQTLDGTFALRQSDIQGECNASRFSDAPETNGAFTLTLDANAGTASGSLQGGGSGTRGISCPEQNPVPSAQMDWQQDYSATFSGSFDSGSSEISMSGTLEGSNNIRWHDCKAGEQPLDCNADFGLNDFAQPYSFPVTFNGKYDAATNSASGTWTVSPIARPTSGDWNARGAPPAQPTSVPPSATPVPPTIAPQPTTSTNTGGDVVSPSDTISRPNTNDPCALGSTSGGGRQLFYLPIFPSAASNPEPLGALIVDGALQNNGLDFGGFQYALSDACAQPRGVVRGADMGQDLNIRADLFAPTNSAGLITQAGPYFRSRAAAYADGIIGGESAGYWVQLHSTGEVKIKQLNPFSEIAASCKPATFDAGAMHTLEIAASGNQLRVALDGKLQTFKQNNEVASTVNIPATGGANNGTAGIAFGAETNRGQIGGQRADDIAISAYAPLDLPLQDNCSGASAASPTVPAATAQNPGAADGTPTTGGTTTPGGANSGGTGNPNTNATAQATGSSNSSGAPTQVAVITPTTIAAQGTSSQPGTGDCNNDGKLTEVDALCALQISVQLTDFNLAMDIDGNGFVDSRDAVIILQRAVGQ